MGVGGGGLLGLVGVEEDELPPQAARLRVSATARNVANDALEECAREKRELTAMPAILLKGPRCMKPLDGISVGCADARLNRPRV